MKYPKLIIGIAIATILLIQVNTAYADDCEDSLYDNEFSCASESVYSYCSSSAKASRTNLTYNLYEGIYCNSDRDNEDDIYEAVATQLQAEDPKWDEDLVQFFLLSSSTKGITEYMEDTLGSATATDKLPAVVKKAFFETNEFLEQDAIRERVKTAYENQKIIHLSKESLKQQFESREIWANASLSDSPFDLITDLNLIEITLFGSKATWVTENDVWSWASGGSSDPSKAVAGTGTGAGTTPSAGAGATPATGTGTGTGTGTSSGDDDYTCVPDDKTKTTTTTDPTKTSPGTIPTNCGNGTIDGSEECDDGNNTAGDGCSEACEEEEGASLMCQDSDSITFKTFTAKTTTATTTTGSSAGSSAEEEEIPLDCDSGSSPKKTSDLTQSDKEKLTTQSANYPGPFIGGVLKNYPTSNKTDCPPGSTWAQISLAGETVGRCFPTQACADFDVMREFLFGDDYENDETKSELAAAIEAAVCVNVTTAKRPESPYSQNEGCIDCHIMAMNDILDKMLEKNVAPLQNTTQAWGTSSRWGPGFSFNLHVLAGRLKNTVVKKINDLTDKEEADKKMAQNLQDAYLILDPNEESTVPSPQDTLSSVGIVGKNVEQSEEAKQSLFRNMKNYRLVSEATGDQDVHAELKMLLGQLHTSFLNIQKTWLQISNSTTLGEKKQCTF